MRKENEIQDFDLQIRSMLEDASVKAPKGVWKAVSARLGTKKAIAGWMVPAGIGLAFAASLSAALFFGGTFRKAAPDNVVAVVTDKIAPVRAITEPATGIDTRIYEMPVAAVNPVEARETEYVSESSVSPEKEPAVTARETAGVDPFAEMEFQEAVAARKKPAKPSIVIGGTLSGNEGENAARTWMGVDGKGSQSLLQTGVSTYGIPVTFGVGVRIPLSNGLSIGTGLNYTLLTTNFTATCKDDSGNVHHYMHYVGVPLNLYYKMIQLKTFKIFLFGGGEADLCVSSNYRFEGNNHRETVKGKVDGLQYSVNAGLGFSFDLSKKISIYADPSIRYWFPSGHPDNLRTNQPLGFNLEAGLRFNL